MTAIEQTQPRKMSILLGIGIFLIPIIFVWFTLRQGYSTLARVVSFVWLILTLIIVFAPSNQTVSSSNTTAERVASVSNEQQTTTAEHAEAVETPPQEQQVTAIEVSARQLFNAYKANEVSADRQFKNQELIVSGTVQSIESGINDGAEINFYVGDEYGIEFVTASGDENFDNNAANLSKGQQISLRCLGAGEVMGFPFLKNCSF